MYTRKPKTGRTCSRCVCVEGRMSRRDMQRRQGKSSQLRPINQAMYVSKQAKPERSKQRQMGMGNVSIDDETRSQRCQSGRRRRQECRESEPRNGLEFERGPRDLEGEWVNRSKTPLSSKCCALRGGPDVKSLVLKCLDEIRKDIQA